VTTANKQHTIDGMKEQDAMPQDLPALGHMDPESMWIYAACDEASSVALAKGGLEVCRNFFAAFSFLFSFINPFPTGL
jgi:hypothetical protein